MSITLFGSCRLSHISNTNNLNNKISYTHCTKEVIQTIKYLKEEHTILKPYNKLCFRTGIVENRFIEPTFECKQLLLDSNICIIEICSNKKYIHNNHYLHHLCVDRRFMGYNYNTPAHILYNHVIEKQNDEEIETDILEIQRLLEGKQIIIVSHYNSHINGTCMQSRDYLIHLLESICKKHDIHFINPTTALSDFKQEEIMTNDLGHYTELGLKEFGKFMDEYLQTITSTENKTK